jgi:hypothetical protein
VLESVGEGEHGDSEAGSGSECIDCDQSEDWRPSLVADVRWLRRQAEVDAACFVVGVGGVFHSLVWLELLGVLAPIEILIVLAPCVLKILRERVNRFSVFVSSREILEAVFVDMGGDCHSVVSVCVSVARGDVINLAETFPIAINIFNYFHFSLFYKGCRARFFAQKFGSSIHESSFFGVFTGCWRVSDCSRLGDNSVMFSPVIFVLRCFLPVVLSSHSSCDSLPEIPTLSPFCNALPASSAVAPHSTTPIHAVFLFSPHPSSTARLSSATALPL